MVCKKFTHFLKNVLVVIMYGNGRADITGLGLKRKIYHFQYFQYILLTCLFECVLHLDSASFTDKHYFWLKSLSITIA